MPEWGRLAAFLSISLISLLFGAFALERELLHQMVIYFGYFNILLAFSLFAWASVRSIPSSQLTKIILPADSTGRIAVVFVSFLLLLAEPFEFKIVFDEVAIAATAQMMHFDRLAGMPTAANDLTGSYILLNSILDKRPLFFPFLISILHDLTGFRYENAFILNGILTIVLVRLLKAVGDRLAGRKGGTLSVLLLGTLPMVSIYTTSGHFEILNLVMLLATVLFAIEYLKAPSGTTLPPLALGTFLLSQVRYENVVYILPFGLLILLGWRLKQTVLLPVKVLLVPLFYILPLLHFRLILGGSTQAFQEGPNGRTATFAWSYAADNLASAGRFLFSLGHNQPNSYFISVLGLAALIAFLSTAMSKSGNLSGKWISSTIALFFLLAVFFNALVVTFFNFGLLDVYITHRLGLPLHLLFILLIPYAIRRYPANYAVVAILVSLTSGWAIFSWMDPQLGIILGMRFGMVTMISLIWLLVLWRNPRHAMLQFQIAASAVIMAVSLPVMNSHRYSERYKSNDLVMASLKFVEERAENERILWIAVNSGYPALLNEVSFTSAATAKDNINLLEKHLDRQQYQAIYFSSTMHRQKDGTYAPREDQADTSWLISHPVAEVILDFNTKLVFMEVTGISKLDTD